MKGTEIFKKTIGDYLQSRGEQDELFVETLKKENKNIDECVSYILKEVQKSGCNGFEDQEIFGMAVHYYDEDDIKNIKPVSANVVVNHKIELTPEDLVKAKQDALEKVVEEEKAKLTKKKAPAPKKENTEEEQVFLFE